MKKVILTLSIALGTLFTVSAQSQPGGLTPVSENKNTADIKFENEAHDFTTITEGTQASHNFKFVNTGKEPLVLSNVQASCGCTTPSWPKEPIMPGKSGVITATFNSTGRPGNLTKSITVTSNAKSGIKSLTIKGNVEQAKKEPTSPVQNPN